MMYVLYKSFLGLLQMTRKMQVKPADTENKEGGLIEVVPLFFVVPVLLLFNVFNVVA